MANWLKRIGLLLILAAIGAIIWVAMRERPVLVDLADVITGPMAVHIEQEGVARVRDIYTVSAPIAGRLERSSLEEGQLVEAGITSIASIHPLDPPLLDERTVAELKAARQAANSAIALADVDQTRAEMAFNLARSEYERASKLAKTNVISDSQLERTYSEMQLREAEVASARAQVELRKAELESVEAKLSQPGDPDISPSNGGCCVEVTSPIDGVVLSVIARSEQAVQQGTRIAEIGDTSRLEIAVDLLSSDAPRVKPGTPVEFKEWGGDEKLTGTVRRIDPSAFTKVSALGIEEQRVNAIIDLDEVPESLGHGYRVIASIAIWSAESTLQLPLGALFRDGGEWAVFVESEGRAKLQEVEVGRMNNSVAQILGGVLEGAKVILYPSDTVEDGTLIENR